MEKVKQHLLTTLAAIGLIQLGSPLAYLTIGPTWYGCYSSDTFDKIKSLLYIPLVDEVLTWLYNHPGIISDVAGALIEELTYRGPVFLTLIFLVRSKHKVVYRIVLVVSCLFSTVHFSLGHACPLHPSWISIILTAAVFSNKSLVSPTLAHILWNASQKIDFLIF